MKQLSFVNYKNVLEYPKMYVLSFPEPRPECVRDPDCSSQLACINEKCKNPCYSHTCGRKAECKVKNHRPTCVCLPGLIGNPRTICEERKSRFLLWFLFNAIIHFTRCILWVKQLASILLHLKWYNGRV